MDVFKTRLESFTRPKRGKGGAKSQSNLKWPHPEYFLATPETLAEAGFYFDPSSEDKDNVTCYMCGKELSEWDEKDNPFEIHFKKCGKKCAWANVRCGLGAEMDPDGRFVFTDKNRLPTSKSMEKARLETFLFGDGWIHDQERNHGASSKKMAKAGFVYSPHDAHDDTAVCIYCGISLSGWDADDDPTEEHRDRVKKAGNPCPMFPDIVFAPPPLKSSKSHTRSKSKSSHVDVTMPMKTYDGSDDDTITSHTTRTGSVASTSTAKTPKAPRTAKKGAKTPRSRSVSRTRNISVEVDDEDDVEDLPPPAAKTSRKAPTTTTRSSSISRTRSVASIVDSDGGTGTEDEVSLKRSTSTRSKGKAKETGTSSRSTDDEGGVSSKKKGSKGRSQSKTRVSVIPEDMSDNGAVEPPPPPPKSTKKSVARKPSTSSAKPNHQHEKDQDSDVLEPAPSSKGTKPISNSVAAAAALFDDNVEVDITEQIHNPLPVRPTRTTRKSTKPPVGPGTSTTTKKSTLTRSASAASVRGAKSRAKEEVDNDDDPLDDIHMHVPPISPPPVELGPEAEVESQRESVPQLSEAKPTNSQRKLNTKKNLPPVNLKTDFSDQDPVLPPPPVPPRSPSRPKAKPLPTHTPDMDDGGGVVPERHREAEGPVERSRMSSRSRSGTRESSSTNTNSNEPMSKPTTLLKSATMKKKGSFLNSRSSTQSRTGVSIDQVMNISSDEGDEDEVENFVRMVEPVKTQSRILTHVKPPPQGKTEGKDAPALTSTTDSTSNDSLVPAWGSVQAKIAQIEKTVETESGRISPFKPKLASTTSFIDEPKPDVSTVKTSEFGDRDVQMDEPSNLANEINEEVKEDVREVSPILRPAVTPPRLQQQQVPTSPFKTPFRFGMGPGNPFNVPPTPGAPMESIPAGIPIPLSREPFVPTQELSETELSMTVEEWVRYHMQIEYDKFKEDGEREIDAFLRTAEQVRKTIEAL
ncbi:hypothetical protein C8R41DRAFT_395401 [Lentinula lateritia]|uniref:BIR-domain-containing protein n=1 Tax=Lentinula lateritia TaxID=40482 RepID=A0ABQ8VDN9_9AGAR|nr:hypothetical protein C8R41DRAFT_395401 [Lentinula lateritia]